MNPRQFVRACAATMSLALVGAAAYAQQPKPFEPVSGQAGKDVVWVPTPQPLVEKMLDMAKVTPQDVVMDLGSGDGRTVITAAKRGARAFGIEYNPDMVKLSQQNATKAGVTDKATFIQGDFYETDLDKAQVITMFLLPSINMKLRPKILEMRPGTRVVTNSFTMEDWQADETETVGGDCTSWCTAHLWIVPAKVEGTWSTPQGALVLKQSFQMLSGTMSGAAISDAKMTGDQIQFTANGTKYSGRVNGSSISGGNLNATKKS
jgi:precorrin-6B methylase 2